MLRLLLLFLRLEEHASMPGEAHLPLVGAMSRSLVPCGASGSNGWLKVYVPRYLAG
jgi:hypothetical protein